MNTHLVWSVLAMVDTSPDDVDPITGKGPEWGKAAPVGLLVILLMGIATFFLLRSMTRKIKNVPASFDPPAGEPPVTAVPDGTAEAATDEQSESEQAGPEPGGSGLVDDRSR